MAWTRGRTKSLVLERAPLMARLHSILGMAGRRPMMSEIWAGMRLWLGQDLSNGTFPPLTRLAGVS